MELSGWGGERGLCKDKTASTTRPERKREHATLCSELLWPLISKHQVVCRELLIQQQVTGLGDRELPDSVEWPAKPSQWPPGPCSLPHLTPVTSPSSSPSVGSSPQVPLLFLEHSYHMPTSGPLHPLSSLPGLPFPQMSHGLPITSFWSLLQVIVSVSLRDSPIKVLRSPCPALLYSP